MGYCAPSGLAHFAKVLARQHLALFHRRLIEGVDAQQIGGDDRLQHEMHQQRAEARSSSRGETG